MQLYAILFRDFQHHFKLYFFMISIYRDLNFFAKIPQFLGNR